MNKEYLVVYENENYAYIENEDISLLIMDFKEGTFKELKQCYGVDLEEILTFIKDNTDKEFTNECIKEMIYQEFFTSTEELELAKSFITKGLLSRFYQELDKGWDNGINWVKDRIQEEEIQDWVKVYFSAYDYCKDYDEDGGVCFELREYAKNKIENILEAMED